MMPFLQVVLWLLAALPFALLVFALAAATVGWRGPQRSIKIGSGSPCPKCQKAVGRTAVLEAKERYSKKVQELRKAHPGVKLRLVAEWEIQCPHCGCKFYFYPEGNRIETESILARASQPSQLP